MTQGLVRYFLFLLAYTPIYIIAALKTAYTNIETSNFNYLCIKEIASYNLIPLCLLGLTIILSCYFFIYSRLALKPKGNPIFIIKSISPQHKEYVTYLGTYILPFVALEVNTILDMIAVVFMFLTIGFIFSKTNLIYTNPTLAFFKYDIYEVEDSNGNKYDCITKDIFLPGDRPKGLKLGDKTFIISQWKNKN